MPRYKLFLLERPGADTRTVERAAWTLPSALDVPRLTKALKGELQVDWLEIASSDRKREIVKIQKALSAVGCMLAFDDGGSSLRRDLTGAIQETLSAEARRKARERDRERSIFERGGAVGALRDAVARHGRAALSWLAGIGVMGGSVVLLVLWLGTGQTTSGSPDPSTLARLAAFGRSDANLPAVPDTADGEGGAEPAEPTSRRLVQPPAESAADGPRPAIPDVPSGGSARAARSATPKPKPAAPTARPFEIAGFVLGLGWAGGFEVLARRARRQSRSRALWMRVLPSLATATVVMAALVWTERPAPVAKPQPQPQPKPAAALTTSRPTRAPVTRARPSAIRPRRTTSTAAQTPPKRYRELLALMVPSPQPCADAGTPLASFLCLERLRRPEAAFGLAPDSGAAPDAEPAEAESPTATPAAVRRREAAPISPPAALAANAPPHRETKASAAASPGTSATGSAPTPAAPVGAPALSSIPRAQTNSSAPARPSASDGTGAQHRPSAVTAPNPASLTAALRVASPPIASANPASSADARAAGGTQPAPSSNPAPAAAIATPAARAQEPHRPPAESARALPTFLLGLLAGSVGLSILALGSGPAGTRRERRRA